MKTLIFCDDWTILMKISNWDYFLWIKLECYICDLRGIKQNVLAYEAQSQAYLVSAGEESD